MTLNEGYTHPSRNGWDRLGRAALVLFCASPVLACVKQDASNPNLPPNKKINIDCTAKPRATVSQRIVPQRSAQIINLNVQGDGYKDKLRVRVFSPNSDLEIYAKDDLYHLMRADRLETKKPLAVKLPHGALTVQEVEPEASDQASLPQVTSSASASVVAPKPEKITEVLLFTLGCEQPATAAMPQTR